MAGSWSFFSNHGLALLAVARQPDIRVREVAAALEITERAAQGILNDLVEAGYLRRIRTGRRNRYVVHGERPLRHPTTRHHSVAELVSAMGAWPRGRGSRGDRGDG